MRALIFGAVLATVGCSEAGWRPSHAPLEVIVTTQDLSQAQLNALERGVERWRAELGAEVIRLTFAPMARAGCGQVDLSFVPMPGAVNGRTIRRACRASIILQSDMPPNYMGVVVAHEFGHALGLEHQADHHSLMNFSAPFDGGFVSDEQLDYVQNLLD